MTVGAVDLGISMFTPDHVQRWREAEAALGISFVIATEKNRTGDVKERDKALVAAGNVVLAFFGQTFGKDIAKMVFGEEASLERCMDAFSDISAQMGEQEQKMDEKLARYVPTI